MKYEILIVLTLVILITADPAPPIWPTQFKAFKEITASDCENQLWRHNSELYYRYDDQVKAELHVHINFCFGWYGNPITEFNCSYLINGNVYLISPKNCCMAMPGNGAVPPNWLNYGQYLGKEIINGQETNHWYLDRIHEYWADVNPPFDGVRYTSNNFYTPRSISNYKGGFFEEEIDPAMFELPDPERCQQTCTFDDNTFCTDN